MTYNEMAFELLQRLGNRTDISNRIPTWINAAYFDLLMTPYFDFYELDGTFSFSSVAAQRVYTSAFPGDFWFILSLRDDTNEREIRRTSYKALDRKRRVNGQPTWYTQFSGQIELDPTPDGVYTYSGRYRKRVNAVTAGGTFVLPVEWHDILESMATIKAYEALELPDKAAMHRNLLQVKIAPRMEAAELDKIDEDTTIQVYLGRH